MSILAYDVKDGVAYLTIQSPPANALSSTLLLELEEKLKKVEADKSVKAIVLKGEGRFFSAGADIKEFTSFQDSSDSKSLAQKGQELFNKIEHFPVPVIAAIHGAALGGGLELAMACHIRIVTKTAKLGLPELTLGIIPGFAGTQRLPQHVGNAKAYEMILSGEPISGEEAYHFGLANRVVEEDELFTETSKLAKKIAEKSRPSIQHIMNLVPYAKTELFDRGLEAEANAFKEVFGSQDAKEGIQAFLEKRKPNFIDK
ncbi:enoyl-CoA hydratase [Oceanobacillus picturae]|jgi:enoyl-CoA hydratase|uniref:Enoyl-CoA hydratase n=1 Tax=Oceanobacillus picturae TaxID=171693 RepID=W9A7E1_9BACI|nr:enoyl-CoA hydratase [Oceanobacillus picturae]GAQ18955.1 enoyl-CoA hydratase [Oceanobacillus picturae]CDO01694.1 putative enoyl-CoA hydratase [Oceanobacillus picturae]